MPELPEVETIKRDLEKRVVGKEIRSIWSDHPKMVNGIGLKDFEKEIRGKQIVGIRRRAKNLLLELNKDLTVWIHLKMTGHLLFYSKNPSVKELNAFNKDPHNRYIHFIFYFKDKTRLAFSDLRKFGKIRLIKAKTDSILKDPQKFGLGNPGMEPFSKEYTVEKLTEAFSKRKKAIKLVLLDQSPVAGIGNIYASEILFEAKINPFKSASKLSLSEIKRIYKKIPEVLKKAIKARGTSVSDFRDVSGQKGNFGQELKVYKQSLKQCPRCGSIILRKKQGQRSTFYCSKCQV